MKPNLIFHKHDPFFLGYWHRIQSIYFSKYTWLAWIIMLMAMTLLFESRSKQDIIAVGFLLSISFLSALYFANHYRKWFVQELSLYSKMCSITYYKKNQFKEITKPISQISVSLEKPNGRYISYKGCYFLSIHLGNTWSDDILNVWTQDNWTNEEMIRFFKAYKAIKNEALSADELRVIEEMEANH